MMLHVEFMSGEIKHYDVKPLIDKWKVFKDLAQDELFNLVRVDKGGYGIVWNEYTDLSCNELWENGYVIESENRSKQQREAFLRFMTAMENTPPLTDEFNEIISRRVNIKEDN